MVFRLNILYFWLCLFLQSGLSPKRNTPILTAQLRCSLRWNLTEPSIRTTGQSLLDSKSLSILATDHHADSNVRLEPPRPLEPHLFAPSCPVWSLVTNLLTTKRTRPEMTKPLFSQTFVVGFKKDSAPGKVSHLVDKTPTANYKSLWRFVCTET
jgi:hypothetical protein